MLSAKGTGGGSAAANSPGFRPGWLSRSQAMVVLKSPLRAFRLLRPFVRPAANLAARILKRWADPILGRSAWHGSLQLERQVAARGNAAYRVFRRLTERWNEKGEPRSAFHPLSLPRGIIEADSAWESPFLEDEAASSSPVAFDALEGSASQDQPLGTAGDAAPGFETSSLTHAQEPTLLASPTPSIPAEAARARGEMQFARPARRREIQRADWPYRLVSLLHEPGLPGLARTETLTRAQAMPTTTARAVRVQSGPGSALRRNGPRELEGRPILQLQPRMPVSSLSLPAAFSAANEQAIQTGLEEPLANLNTRILSQDQAGGIPAFSPDLERTGSKPSDETPPRRTVRQAAQPGSARPTEAASKPLTRSQPAQGILSLARSDRVGETSPSRDVAARSTLAAEWPLFGVLRDLARPPEMGESTALRVLRRMWPEAQNLPGGPALQDVLQAGAALGAGEPLAPELRRGMEASLGRDLGEVRLHTSSLAQTLRAEAFTSGRNIVFAPGRFEPGTPQGLALLGHELTHLGQALAFKQASPDATAGEDSQEQAARTQEERILQVIEKGWPEPAAREFQHPGRGVSPSPAAAISGVSMVQRAVEINELEVEPPRDEPSPGEQPGGSQATSSFSGGQGGVEQTGQSGPGRPGGAGAPTQAANLDALARQVYTILKDRLRTERDRHHLYRF